MIWLLRKLLIPAVAFGFGMWFQADQHAKACDLQGGRIVDRVCKGGTP
ncbi:hypothetical protein [Actibacterium lipolyticum]|uniref:Uncharacterized protein n=1 Tax=Actibacterium lipolyticum TaxID=1524263 RepID=A0A238KS26_9RHOB|nr:hypothetical protein [Actibacterium lipolyticum]SMX45615.1 hypothetical protein COL8621_02847 [Actibacterium lipolyticum]